MSSLKDIYLHKGNITHVTWRGIHICVKGDLVAVLYIYI